MKKKLLSLDELVKVLKEFKKEVPPITLAIIEEAMKDVNLPSIEHYEWNEDGRHYSSWKISAGGYIMCTGDGGKELLDKAFLEHAFKK